MSIDRSYTCLACSDRPVFHGKLAAALHIREVHAALLADRHPDELLAEGPRFEHPDPDFDPEDQGPPYDCLVDRPNCTSRFYQKKSCLDHLEATHGILGASYGEDYISESQLREHERELERQRDLLIDQACDRMFLTMQGSFTVSDFLTECRA